MITGFLILGFAAYHFAYPILFPPKRIVPFENTLDMNDPLNRERLKQLTKLDFPDTVKWESAKITYNPIPQHLFEGKARMTRKQFDEIFAKVKFREYGDHIGSPDHPYQGTADYPWSRCNLRAHYERSFEAEKDKNPETLVDIFWFELKARNGTPFPHIEY